MVSLSNHEGGHKNMTDLTIAQIEAATFTAWPAITTAMDGMWLARFARGFTKRSNSIQCVDPRDDGDAEDRPEPIAGHAPGRGQSELRGCPCRDGAVARGERRSGQGQG